MKSSSSRGATSSTRSSKTGIKAKSDQQKDHGRDLIQNLVEQLVDPSITVDKNVVKTINARIAAIDELVSKQVDEIMHHEAFQKLEGSWRGLNKLVMGSETSEMLKIRVFNTSKKDLQKDFEGAAEFTESALWRKVYQDEFGTYGGDAFAAIVGDYEFGKGAQDVALLSHMSEVAAGAHAPFLTAAGASMFGLESFTEMPKPRDLAKIFDKNNPENTKWLSFRDSEDSRYVAMVMPHVLRRLPYGDENPIDEFDYQETIAGEHENYLWGNAAYDLANRMTDAFAQYHWCVAIRGVEGGGLVEDLPIHTFKTKEGKVASTCPTEVLIPRRPGEGAVGSRLHRPAQREEQRSRRLLRWQLRPAAEEVQHGRGDGERRSVLQAALPDGDEPDRALPEVDLSRQDRLLHVALQDGVLPQQLDQELHAGRRRREPGRDGRAAAA